MLLAPPAFAPSAELTVRRLRARPLAVAGTTIALVAAAGLVGWSSLTAALAQQRSVALRLGQQPPQQRALRIVYYEIAGAPDVHAAQARAAARELRDLGSRSYQVTIWHPIAPSGPDGTSFVVASDPAVDATVIAGRFPRGPCDPKRCEVLALSRGLQIGRVLRVGPVRPVVVGIGSLRPVAAARDSLVGSTVLLARSLGHRSLEPLLRAKVGMTSVTTVPLDPKRVQAASLDSVISRLRQSVVRLNRSDSQNLVQATAPTALLEAIETRGVVARDRLLLIAGQAAALVIAFAAFAASTRRRDVRLVESQLLDLGATRIQAWVAGALEAVLPGLLALALVFGGLAVAATLQTPASTSRAAFLSTVLSTTTVLTIVAIVVVAVGLLAFTGSRPTKTRFGAGPLELAALLALGVVVWQAATNGGLDASELAASGSNSPVLFLLPTLSFFVSAVVLLRVLPLLGRVVERASRHAPVSIRLASLGATRNPAQTAIATTFLAVAVGAATFSLDYRATLDRQAHDQAAYEAGALWRVSEESTQAPAAAAPGAPSAQTPAGSADVAPLTRYASVSSEPPVPVLRSSGEQIGVSTAPGQAGFRTELLALPASRLQDVRGWRAGFASTSRAELARLLRPHPVVFAGDRIARSAKALRVWVKTLAPYPTAVTLWFLLPGQDTRSANIGTVAPGRWELLRYPLRPELRGSELVGVDLDAVTQSFGPNGYRGTIWVGPFEQREGGAWTRLGRVGGWTTPTDSFDRQGRIARVAVANGPVRAAVRYVRNGTTFPFLRPDAHVPDPIPVLASKAVAGSAVDGIATLQLPGSRPLAIHVVATAKLFPTIEDEPRFVIADYGTMYAALNDEFPGIAPPSEAWFFEPKPASFEARLAQPPFRLQRLVGAEQEEAALLGDPLARGTRGVLLAAAVVGALLALIGLVVAARAMLRDESVVLAEYETLGVRPSLLARTTALRLALLAVVGVLAGAAGGFLATRLVSALVAITGGGTTPVPPIATTIAWVGTVAVVAAVAAAALLSATALARRAFARPVADRLRA